MSDDGRIPDWMLTHTARIRPLLGRTGTGPAYGDPVDWPCLRRDSRKVARPAEGRTVTCDLQLYLPPEAAGKVPPESEVTVDGERVATVVEVREHIHPGLPTPDHVHLLCG